MSEYFTVDIRDEGFWLVAYFGTEKKELVEVARVRKSLLVRDAACHMRFARMVQDNLCAPTEIIRKGDAKISENIAPVESELAGVVHSIEALLRPIYNTGEVDVAIVSAGGGVGSIMSNVTDERALHEMLTNAASKLERERQGRVN